MGLFKNFASDVDADDDLPDDTPAAPEPAAPTFTAPPMPTPVAPPARKTAIMSVQRVSDGSGANRRVSKTAPAVSVAPTPALEEPVELDPTTDVTTAGAPAAVNPFAPGQSWKQSMAQRAAAATAQTIASAPASPNVLPPAYAAPQTPVADPTTTAPAAPPQPAAIAGVPTGEADTDDEQAWDTQARQQHAASTRQMQEAESFRDDLASPQGKTSVRADLGSVLAGGTVNAKRAGQLQSAGLLDEQGGVSDAGRALLSGGKMPLAQKQPPPTPTDDQAGSDLPRLAGFEALRVR